MDRLTIIVAAGLALSACSADSGQATCVSGQTSFCACQSGVEGVQTCGDDGRFGPCLCDDAGTDAAAEADLADAGEDVAADSGIDTTLGDEPDLAPEADLAADSNGEDRAADTVDVDQADTPPEGPAIQVEVTWVTPGDPDPTDSGAGRGSDLDLHLLHPDGTWNEAPFDCFWQVPSPDWGEVGAVNDPSLVEDDSDGNGPELIELDQPQGTEDEPLVYQIGVYYFSDHTFGPSDATVRVLIYGEEAYVGSLIEMQEDSFWHVAQVQWPGGDVEEVDEVYPEGFPP